MLLMLTLPVVLLLLGAQTGAAQDPIKIPRACLPPHDFYPFCDPKLPTDARVHDLIARLNAEEKPPLLTARMSPKGNVSRLGLPAYDWGANCVHGVQSRCVFDTESLQTVCPSSFAMPSLMAASFSRGSWREFAARMGRELRALWLAGAGENHANSLPEIGLDCWSPNININRDPRWGRNQEVPGEDPFLSGRFATEYSLGLQYSPREKRFLQGVTTIKHWDAYSLEHYGNVTRHNFDAKVDAYDLQHTYFPAFRAAVEDGHAKGFMCSYNALNGIPTCANGFLNRTLRGDFGFDGYVTSDSGAVADIYEKNAHHYVPTAEDAVAVALNAQTDINSGTVYLDHIKGALAKGLIQDSDVNRALFHSLKLRFELGLFDPVEDQYFWHVPLADVNTRDTQAFNLRLTEESLVMLKNDNGAIPLSRGKRLAVLGPLANATYGLLGNYLGQICPEGYKNYDCVQKPVDALRDINGKEHTSYEQGCTVQGTDKSGFAAAVAAAKAADSVVIFVGLDEAIEAEGHDRYSIKLPGVQHELIDAVASGVNPGTRVIIVLINGGAVALDAEKNHPAVRGIVETFYPGFYGALAVGKLLYGLTENCCGRLPVTIYQSDYVNQVDFLSMSMTKAPGRTYRYFTGEPLWPFGHGMSLTEFEVSWNPPAQGTDERVLNNMGVSSRKAAKQVGVSYTAVVKNVGTRTGDDVVLAFFEPGEGMEQKQGGVPLIRQLFGFERVHLRPGESKEVHFPLQLSDVAMPDSNGTLWSVPGTGRVILTDKGAGDPHGLRSTFTVTGERIPIARLSV